MNILLLFIKEDNSILNNYILISKNTLEEKDYKKYLKKYPALENEELYIIKDLNKEEQEKLNSIIAKPLMMLSMVTNEEQAEIIKNQIIETMNSMKEYDDKTPIITPETMSKMSLIDILKAMPESQLDSILLNMEEKLDTMNESILQQAAISAVKEEYKEIGINTDNLQNKYIFITGIQMLGVALVSMVSAVIIMLLSSRVAAKLRKNIKR